MDIWSATHASVAKSTIHNSSYAYGAVARNVVIVMVRCIGKAWMWPCIGSLAGGTLDTTAIIAGPPGGGEEGGG